MLYQGSCHCEKVLFEVSLPEKLEVEECNCSICKKSGFLHLILPLRDFKLVAGEEYLSHYRFNTKVAVHKFCKVCGIKPFYIPRSNPDGIDVNFRCLNTVPKSIEIVPFDGQNWEDNAHTLSHKSR